MNRFLIPVASIAGALVLAGAIFTVGNLIATDARASGAFPNGGGAPWLGAQGGPWGAGDHGAWAQQLPPELKGLSDIPASDRFNHFRGVTINLTDQNDRPMSVTVTPGTVTSVSGNSLSLAANDGSTKTYALDANTIQPGKTVPAANDKVAVVTLNGSSTATAVMTAPPNGFGPPVR